jgi:GT2 family glycosyltransferase
MFVVALSRPRTIVELGTHHGDSYCALCQAVAELELDSKCFAVGAWHNDPQTGVYDPEALADLKAHHDPLYGSFSQLVRAAPGDALGLFEDGAIDLLHIEGDNTYGTAEHNFKSWLPKMSAKGAVLLHDVAGPAGGSGVRKLWEELSAARPSMAMHHGGGIGLLGVGDDLEPGMNTLLEAPAEERERIGQLFKALGRRWELEVAVASSVKETRGLEKMIDALLGQIDAHASATAAAEEATALPYGLSAEEDRDDYHRWIKQGPPSLSEVMDAVPTADPSRSGPVISVVIPVFRPPLEFFRKAVESVRAQTYSRWELCLTDDGSGDPRLSDLLREYERADKRIKVRHNTANQGISRATNDALDLATGEFVAFMDHDDELEPDALESVASVLTGDPSIDVAYTDEDKIDEDGIRYAPLFKPDWSPDYLLSRMYIAHLSVVRKKLVEEVGRLRPEYDGSQDHDLMLRVTEKTDAIVHVPRVLYHWRAVAGSAAQVQTAKLWAHEAGDRALQDALDRRGEDAVALPGPLVGNRRVKRRIRSSPLVSIVIPFRDGADMLERCIDSIRSRGGYDRWEAILVNNQSWEPETTALINKLSADSHCRVLDYPQEFNWSALNNMAAEQTEGEVLLFLNNDVEGISGGWLSALLEHAQRPEVGAVGARLVYPTGELQHAGVVIGMGGVAQHVFRLCPAGHHAYFGMDWMIRNYSAVTGACMMVRRDVFKELEGFDETFRVAYNDIDFCLRVRDRGYLVVYTPYAELIHYESVTRGVANDRPEVKEMLKRWLPMIQNKDPYFNPNLSLWHPEFRLPHRGEILPWSVLS